MLHESSVMTSDSKKYCISCWQLEGATARFFHVYVHLFVGVNARMYACMYACSYVHFYAGALLVSPQYSLIAYIPNLLHCLHPIDMFLCAYVCMHVCVCMCVGYTIGGMRYGC